MHYLLPRPRRLITGRVWVKRSHCTLCVASVIRGLPSTRRPPGATRCSTGPCTSRWASTKSSEPVGAWLHGARDRVDRSAVLIVERAVAVCLDDGFKTENLHVCCRFSNPVAYRGLPSCASFGCLALFHMGLSHFAFHLPAPSCKEPDVPRALRDSGLAAGVAGSPAKPRATGGLLRHVISKSEVPPELRELIQGS